MRCPWCGKMLEEDEIFCSECGKKVRGSSKEIGEERPVIDNSYENNSYKEGAGRNYNIGRNYSPQEPGVRKSSTGIKVSSGFSSGAVEGKAAAGRTEPGSGSHSLYSDRRPEEAGLYSGKSGDPGYPIEGSEILDHKEGSGLGITLMAAGITVFVLMIGIGAFFLLRGNGHSHPVSKNQESKNRDKGNGTNKSGGDKTEEAASTEKGEWSTVSPDYTTEKAGVDNTEKTTGNSTQTTSTTTESTSKTTESDSKKKADNSTKDKKRNNKGKPLPEEDKTIKLPPVDDRNSDSNTRNGGSHGGEKTEPTTSTTGTAKSTETTEVPKKEEHTGTVSDVKKEDKGSATFKLQTEDKTISCYTDDKDIIDQLEDDEKIRAVGIMDEDSVLKVSEVEVKERAKKEYKGIVSEIEKDDEDGVTFKLKTEDETIKCHTDDEEIIANLGEDDNTSVS